MVSYTRGVSALCFGRQFLARQYFADISDCLVMKQLRGNELFRVGWMSYVGS